MNVSWYWELQSWWYHTVGKIKFMQWTHNISMYLTPTDLLWFESCQWARDWRLDDTLPQALKLIKPPSNKSLCLSFYNACQIKFNTYVFSKEVVQLFITHLIFQHSYNSSMGSCCSTFNDITKLIANSIYKLQLTYISCSSQQYTSEPKIQFYHKVKELM